MLSSDTFGSQLRSINGLPLAVMAVLISATLHNYLGVVTALALVLWLPSMFRGQVCLEPLSIAFYLAALYAFLRAFFPAEPVLVVQLQEVVRFAAIAIFITAVRRIDLPILILILKLFFALMISLIPLFLLTGHFGGEDASGQRRFSGLMPHANHLGYVAAASALTLAHASARFRARGVLIWAFVLVGLVLFTRSSGALLVLVLGFVYFSLSGGVSTKQVLIFIFLTLLLVLLVNTPTGQLALEKILVIDLGAVFSKSETYQFGNQGSSLAWRLSYWTAMINEQVANGIITVLFGQGAGASTLGHELYFFMEKDPHSDFVKVFIDYGVFGFCLMFILLGRAAWLTGFGWLALIVFLGPMLTGNSLTSSPVIFLLICNLHILSCVRRSRCPGAYSCQHP